MKVYKSVSQQIHEIFHLYTDLIDPLSLDEAFLDETENKQQRISFKGNTFRPKIKFHEFIQRTKSITQPYELTTLPEIRPLTKQLLKEISFADHSIRLIGLSVSNPFKKEDEREKWKHLSLPFSKENDE